MIMRMLCCLRAAVSFLFPPLEILSSSKFLLDFGIDWLLDRFLILILTSILSFDSVLSSHDFEKGVMLT